MRGNLLFAASVLLVVLLITLGARVFGPGDLFDKDQPKTMAASADVALNGNCIWPRDMIGEPSTKPPLYNWIDAIVLKLSPRRWDEWAFKVPSILAAMGRVDVQTPVDARVRRRRMVVRSIDAMDAA